MITILYPYRNREIQRIKNSLDSLLHQTNKDFNVLFVDYGSETEIAAEVQSFLMNYSFVTYFQTYSSRQPWSRAKAINVGLKKIDTEFVFVADIDMIFRSDFTGVLHQLKNKSQSVFFKVGFLSQAESKQEKDFNDYKIAYTSSYGAQGLSLFSLEALKKINGFDEFLHFWGAEDEDIHQRLQLAEYTTHFFESEILMLHQWHPSYRNTENRNLTKDFQLSGITRLNHQHQLQNKNVAGGVIDQQNWGIVQTQEDFLVLEKSATMVTFTNRKEIVDHFLFATLHHFTNGILAVKFESDTYQSTLKYRIKKLMGKKVPQYYSLKEINDKLLLHIISFYHHFPYRYEVSNDLKSIVFKIKK